jgi:hypothetical protein
MKNSTVRVECFALMVAAICSVATVVPGAAFAATLTAMPSNFASVFASAQGGRHDPARRRVLRHLHGSLKVRPRDDHAAGRNCNHGAQLQPGLEHHHRRTHIDQC